MRTYTLKNELNYDWCFNDYPNSHGLTVFGMFVGGGGSTMGYTLAGFNHLGGVELDERMSRAYLINHRPRWLYTCDIRDFNRMSDLPHEFYNLDILDGSPPCSSFSKSGNRDKDWGKEKKFKEGQKYQRLDDLVFEYIKTIDKLRPRVAILENVAGLAMGNAKPYCKLIVEKLKSIDYEVQLFLLNAASMGIPQRRERIFFICSRQDLKFKPLKLSFSYPPITFGQIKTEGEIFEEKSKSALLDVWHRVKPGKSFSDLFGGNRFNAKKMADDKIPFTIAANTGGMYFHSTERRLLNKDELIKIGSFPRDYNFLDIRPQYLIGMSVPPLMTARIAQEIYKQWFNG